MELDRTYRDMILESAAWRCDKAHRIFMDLRNHEKGTYAEQELMDDLFDCFADVISFVREYRKLED